MERGDVRISLAFVDVGIVNLIKFFYVKYCFFYKSFVFAIIVYGINNFFIEWNIMVDLVWFGMYGVIK